MFSIKPKLSVSAIIAALAFTTSMDNFANFAYAADVVAAPPAPAAAVVRTAFDGNIRNNSLALSPDETTAAVSYSERSEVIVYNLQTGTVRGVLRGYVTPRNIVFAPDGKAFYISDSSRGEVVKIDTATLATIGAFVAFSSTST